MIDIRLVREETDRVKAACRDKQAGVMSEDIDRLLTLDGQRRDLLVKIEDLRRERNQVSAGKPDQAQIERGQTIKTELSRLEGEYAQVETDWLAILKAIPNLPVSDVPVGTSEADNVVAISVGEPPQFDFTPKNHAELGEAHGWIDKERAAKVTGARFVYLQGSLVRLHWALIQFGFDVLTSQAALTQIIADNDLKVPSTPFIPVLPPLLIRTAMYDAMDRLEPREDRYKLEGEDLWLQGSAEHVLGPMHAEEIIPEDQLPRRYVGYATSFRREAGTYGKDLEGIFRLHQFEKLEMESLTTAAAGLAEHHFLIAIQEYLMQQLELPYQVILKCTADIGKPNARGVDINTWMAGQGQYRETHTADYMTDYQARRLAMRVRRASGEVELVHTNDATAFAQRPLIAIMENYQLSDGTIRVPTVLQKYYGGETL